MKNEKRGQKNECEEEERRCDNKIKFALRLGARLPARTSLSAALEVIANAAPLIGAGVPQQELSRAVFFTFISRGR